MAIDLKKTDIVIVGLGAVGGVATLPLARAGLDVIGLEAGSWLSPRDFASQRQLQAWPLHRRDDRDPPVAEGENSRT